jgi:tetratricopeptide (TPR) repeat protein
MGDCGQRAGVARLITARFEIAFVTLGVLALVGKLWLALRTYGTNDVYAYEQFAGWAGYLGSGLYAAAWDFNHPPSMLPVLRGLDWAARETGVSFAFWLRLLPTLADAATLLLVYRLWAPKLELPGVRAGLLLLAASPALLLISGFHGNTDSVMIMLVMLSVYLTERRGRDMAAGAALGLALCVKIVPLLAVPALVLYRPGWPRRFRFVAGAALMLAVAWLPWMLPDTAKALSQVFGYRGQYGHWGASWVLTQLFPSAGALNTALRAGGFPLLAAGVLGLSVWMNRGPDRPGLYVQLGVVFAALLAFGSAFGVQYLAWLAPWLVGLPVAIVFLHEIAAGAFLLVVYNFWSGGLPWYLADSNQVGDYQGHADYQQVLCWVSVLVVFGAGLSHVLSRSVRPAHWQRVPASLRHAVVAASAFAVAWPSLALVQRDSAQRTSFTAQALLPIRSRQDINLSSLLLGAGRSEEGIGVARRAAGRDPTQTLAWNNLAAGYAALGRWNDAVTAAERAVHLSPSFQLARNNLAWARQKQAEAQSHLALPRGP